MIKNKVIITSIIAIALIAFGCKSSITVVVKTWENGNIKSKETIKKIDNGNVYHGASVFYYENGKKKEEKYYENDFLIGERKKWYEDGELLSIDNITGYTEHNDSIEDGLTMFYSVINYRTTQFYKNGKLEFKGEYYDWKKNGKWVFYDSIGNITREVIYNMDSVIYERNKE